MLTQDAETEPQTATKNSFAEAYLPLYHGPLVSIRLEPAGPTYQLAKALLCKKSPYFLKMFESNLTEAKMLSATLQEGTHTCKHTFELFIEWLYTGKFTLLREDRSNSFSRHLDLAIFADMSLVGDLTDCVAMSLEQTIKADRDMNSKRETPYWPPDRHYSIRDIKAEHFASVDRLPSGSTVRRVFLIVLVEPYLRNTEFKFASEIVRYPRIGTDLLAAVKRLCLG
ncbi:BTB/POZ domain-containing protein [Aspergillus homomorphus CBS 101889]|uniref:BTB domain-containing protein n=1 Tax=Aspergillus homomorphus (strain CBS 101889) TaxID=1450537 RepID=A0A395HQS5_ASPHC|nr:hypothetical protein BO97DRAFT_427688 [Aspergillus homomorphus CBS 101889]RAL09208.1 hypothetical protein BO97DRAFT_427688 [Aspergillus homomorphus CBS 101889]